MTDSELWQQIQKGSEEKYREVFYKYYKLLVSIALRYVMDVDLAKDLAQDVFLKIWEKRTRISIQTTLKAYLSQAIRNTCLNHLKGKKHFNDLDSTVESVDYSASAVDQLEAEDLQKEIDLAINSMPPACRTVFLLRRMDGLTLKEIASHLQISPKTVENQITKARKILMQRLQHMISIVIMKIINFGEGVGEIIQRIV